MKELRTRYAVLGALTLGPRSGYAIRKLIDESLGNFWRESYGQLYPALHALIADGLVAAGGATAHDDRARRTYAITARGRAALRQWLTEPAADELPRVEVLLKLFFAADLPAARRAAHVRRHVEWLRGVHLARLERYAAIADRLATDHAREAGQPYWVATLRYGQHVSRAVLAWCDETLLTLAPARPARPARTR